MGISSKSSFLVTNTGDAMANWVRLIARDQTAYTIAQMNAPGWYPNGGGTEANFAGGYLEGGSSSEFSLTLAETGEVVSSMNWEAMMSYDGGESFESCGSTTIQIIPAPAPPKISGVSLTVGSSSAVIKFETSLTAEGNILYGVSSEYGGRVSSSAGTSHTITLPNLSPSTTYHYQIQATSEGGTTSTADATFTTSEVSVTTTTTTTTLTNTVTSTVTNVNTVKQVILDTTAPMIRVSPLVGARQKVGSKAETRIYDAAPIIEGSVVDDRGVARVEYRVVERESSWSEANLDQLVGAKKMNWDFLPPVSLDGSYTVEIRAVDVFGNVSPVKTSQFVIDQLLPKVVGGVINYGALPLEARSGVVNVVAGLEYELVIYESGGADEVEVSMFDHKWKLKKVDPIGIWRGNVTIPLIVNSETVGLKAKAIDGAGNMSESEWIKLNVVPEGHVLKNEKQIKVEEFKIYQLDPTTLIYREWDEKEFWPASWRSSRGGNELNFVLPAGSYYFEIAQKIVGSKTRDVVVSQKIKLEDAASIIAPEWEIGEGQKWLSWLGIRRLVPIKLSPLEKNVGGLPSPISEREKWIGKKSVVFVGFPELPWYDQELKQAKVWAEREQAQLVVSRVDIKLENGLLPKTYLIDSKGDTIEYKEGNWKR